MAEPTRRAMGLAGLTAVALARPGAAQAAAPPFRRGVGVYHIAGSGDRLHPDGTYVTPFFSARRQQMRNAEMRALSAAGFDFVRLLVAPDLPMRTQGPDHSQLFAALTAVVSRFRAARLKVVIDVHSGGTLPGFADKDFLADPASPLFARYTAAIGELAGWLARFGPGVALEPFNEPPSYGAADTAKWAAMQRTLHDAARRAAPQLPLILTGGQGGGRLGLLALDASGYRGSNVLWSFHYYDPSVFTHQGSGGHYANLHDVPWPEQASDVVALVAQAAGGALTGGPRPVGPDLAKYALSGAGPADVQRDFDQVAAWATANGVSPDRIFLGEFGVSRSYGAFHGASEADRLQWLTTVRTAAERAGFGWSLWSYSGPAGMTLANEYPAVTLDGATLRALGLRG